MFKVGCALYYSMAKLLVNTILPELHLVGLLYRVRNKMDTHFNERKLYVVC